MLIKILKFCTGSSAKSYQCKFGISRVLHNRLVAAEDLGKAIQDVIHLKTLRGKFSSVHPELRREGIVRVDMGERGLHFVRDEGHGSIVGRDDEEEEEEKLLKQAIALSLEGEVEIDKEEEDNDEVDAQQEDGEEKEEELMLRQAIALSLEGAEEEDD